MLAAARSPHSLHCTDDRLRRKDGASTPAALISPHLMSTTGTIKVEIATGSVCPLGPLVRITARKNSFQVWIATSTAVATNPGAAVRAPLSSHAYLGCTRTAGADGPSERFLYASRASLNATRLSCVYYTQSDD